MRKIAVKRDELVISQKVIGYFTKHVTKYGTGAKIDCPKQFLGKQVVVVICDE
jgi:putative transposon-encoded protein